MAAWIWIVIIIAVVCWCSCACMTTRAVRSPDRLGSAASRLSQRDAAAAQDRRQSIPEARAPVSAAYHWRTLDRATRR